MSFSEVKGALKKNRLLNSAVFFDSIASTNQYLKDNDFSSGTIAVAGEQTAGRGKHGAPWISKKGGLWFSYVINKKIKKPYMFTILSCVAVADALCELKIKPVIKWPNDIIAGGGKVAGILIENDAYNSRLITGIGVNVNNPVPAGDGIHAQSVSKILGKKTGAETLLVSIIKRIDSYIHTLPGSGKKIIASWIKYQGPIEGTMIRLRRGGKKELLEVVKTLKSGDIRVRNAYGRERILSGEVFFK
jgi:BirA family biotin operon repressor/biotin-[acetyl-CoA-carboxylase] ligase